MQTDIQKYREAHPGISELMTEDDDLSYFAYTKKKRDGEIVSNISFTEFDKRFQQRKKDLSVIEEKVLKHGSNLLDIYKLQREVKDKWKRYGANIYNTAADVLSPRKFTSENFKYMVDGADVSSIVEDMTGEEIPAEQKITGAKLDKPYLRDRRQALVEKWQVSEGLKLKLGPLVYNENSLLPDKERTVTGHPTFIKKIWKEAFEKGEYNKTWEEFLNDPKGIDGFSLNRLPQKYKEDLVNGLIDENEAPFTNFDVTFTPPEKFRNKAASFIAGDIGPFALSFLATKKVMPVPSLKFMDETIKALKNSKNLLPRVTGNILKGTQTTTRVALPGEAAVQLLFNPYDERIINHIGRAMSQDESAARDIIDYLSASDKDSVLEARVKLFIESIGLSYIVGGVGFPLAGSTLMEGSRGVVWSAQSVMDVLKKSVNPQYKRMIEMRDKNGNILKEDLSHYSVLFSENKILKPLLHNLILPFFKWAKSLTPKQAAVKQERLLEERETVATATQHISYLDEEIINLHKGVENIILKKSPNNLDDMIIRWWKGIPKDKINAAKNSNKPVKIGNNTFKNQEETWEYLINLISGKITLPRVLPKKKLQWSEQKVGSKAENNRRTIYNTEIYTPKSKKSFKYTIRQAIDPEDQSIVPKTWQIIKTELTGKKRSRVIRTHKSLKEARASFPKEAQQTNVAKLIPDINFKYAGIQEKLKGFPDEIKTSILMLRNITDSLTMSVLKMPHSHLSTETKSIMNRRLGSYIRTQFEMLKNPNFVPTTEATNNFVNLVAKINFKDLDSSKAIAEAKKYVKALHEEHKPSKYVSEDFLTSLNKLHSEVRSIDKMALTKRIYLSPEARAWLGEINDPKSNILETITRLSQLKRTHGTLSDIRSLGEDVIFFKNPVPGKFDAEIGVRDSILKAIQKSTGKPLRDMSAAYGPLQGMFTTPRMAQTLEELINLNTHGQVIGFLRRLSESNSKMGAIYRGFLFNKNYHNFNATVLNNVTHIRNFTAGPLFLLNNGWIVPDPKATAKSIETITNNLGKLKDRDLDAYFIRLQGLGVVNTQVEANFLTETYRIATRSGSLEKWTDDFSKKVTDSFSLVSAIKGVAKGAKNVYVAEDNFWKIAYFEMEKKAWKKAQPTWTNEQIENKVADIVRNTIPNYDMIPQFWEGLKYIPFGKFWAFKYEQYRTATNSFILGAEQIQSTNPDIRRMGAKRLAGSIATNTVGAAGISHEASMVINGISPAQDWAINEISPSWYKNKRNVYYRDPDTGALLILNADYNDPFGDVNEINSNLIKKQLLQESIDIEEFKKSSIDSLYESLVEDAEAVFGMDIGTTALIEAFYDGEDSLGRKIWTDLNDEGEASLLNLTNFGNAIKHIVKSYEPTFWKNYERVDEAMKYQDVDMRSKKNLELEKLAQSTGLRFREENFKQDIVNSLINMKVGRDNIKNNLETAFATKGENEDFYVNAYDTYLLHNFKYNSKIKKVLTASSILGFGPSEQADLLKQMRIGDATERNHYIYENKNFQRQPFSEAETRNILERNPDIRRSPDDYFRFSKSLNDRILKLKAEYHGLVLLNFQSNSLFSDKDIATKLVDEKLSNILPFSWLQREQEKAEFERGKLKKTKGGLIEGPKVLNTKDAPEERIDPYTGEPYFLATGVSLLPTLQRRRGVRQAFKDGGEPEESYGTVIAEDYKKELEGLKEMVTDPLNTAVSLIETVGQLGLGVMALAIPDEFQAQHFDEHEELVKDFGQVIVDNFGTLEKAKQTIIDNPVGTAATVAGLLFGGGYGIRKIASAANSAKAAKVGTKIIKASDVVDPIIGPLLGAGKLISRRDFGKGVGGATLASAIPASKVLDEVKTIKAVKGARGISKFRGIIDNLSPYLLGSKRRDQMNPIYKTGMGNERAAAIERKFPFIGSDSAFGLSTRQPKIQSAIDKLHKQHDLVADDFSLISLKRMDDKFNSRLADQRVRTDKKAFESLQESRKQMGEDFTPTFDAQQSVNEIQVISRKLDNAPNKKVTESRGIDKNGRKNKNITQQITTGTVEGVPVYKVEIFHKGVVNDRVHGKVVFQADSFVEMYIPNKRGLERLAKQKTEKISKRDIITGLRDKKIKGGLVSLLQQRQGLQDGGEPESNFTKEEVMDILNENSNLNFVDRILNPNKYKPYPIEIEGINKGRPYTHRMSTWGNLDDSDAGILAPSVIWTEDKGYQKLKPSKAIKHAMKTGEYLKFKNHSEAAKFERSWKKAWEKPVGAELLRDI